MSSPALSLELHAVSKSFGTSRPAVADVTIGVSAGEIYCLLGGSQAGKTVLVDLAMGLIAPSSGRVSICGIDPSSQPIEARGHLTFAIIGGALRPTMTVARNMRFFSSLTARPSPVARQDCVNALRDVGLPDRVIDQRVCDLSGEATLFVWLAIALLRKSPLVILDDPTRGISTDSARLLQSRLLDLKSRGVAVLVATSDVLFASQVADRLGIVQSGRLTSRRTREQVLGLSLAQLYLDYLGELPDVSASTMLDGRRL
jgi:ABC-2 type transport system ATP-binding protein